MKILVNEKLSNHKYKTPEGYLICFDAILARTGKQTYTSDELFQDGDNKEIDVDRPFNEVINEKTIASFENKPITLEHPEEDVNVGNYKEYAVGYVRDVKAAKADDGTDILIGNLVITDQDVINDIEEGKHTYLSCGYDCEIKDENGEYYQHLIRGNHVALCDNPRAGITRIVDSDNIDDAESNYNYKVGDCFIEKYFYYSGFDKKSKIYDFAIEITKILDNSCIVLKYNLANGKLYESVKADFQFSRITKDYVKIGSKSKLFGYVQFKVSDSVDDEIEDLDKMNDADYNKQTKQGYKILHKYRGSDRLYIIGYKNGALPGYFIGAGYDTSDGTWRAGFYDFKTKEEAINFLKKKYGVLKQLDSLDDSIKDAVLNFTVPNNELNDMLNNAFYNKARSLNVKIEIGKRPRREYEDVRIRFVGRRENIKKLLMWYDRDLDEEEIDEMTIGDSSTHDSYIEMEGDWEDEKLNQKRAQRMGLRFKMTGKKFAGRQVARIEGNRKQIHKFMKKYYDPDWEENDDSIKDSIEDNLLQDEPAFKKGERVLSDSLEKIIDVVKFIKDKPFYEEIKTKHVKINTYGEAHKSVLQKFHSFIRQYLKEKDTSKKESLKTEIINEYNQLQKDYKADINSINNGSTNVTLKEVKSHYNREVNEWIKKVPSIKMKILDVIRG